MHRSIIFIVGIYISCKNKFSSINFISPCILPLLPLYVSYFVGGNENDDKSKYNALVNSLGFVLGFTMIFTLLGTLAGTFGTFIKEQSVIINILGGFIA